MDSEQVRITLDQLIRSGNEDYASVSRLLGRNPTYVQQFIKRGVPRRLSESDRRILARHFNVSERDLGGPDGPQVRSNATDVRDSEDFMLIPYYDVRASAGGGSLQTGIEAPDSALAFQARWVRSIASGGIESLAVIRVEGDSMFPTLNDGDHILLDTADRRVRDGIYVLRTDDSLHVKRLAIHPATGRLTIQSDNPAYPSWPDCPAHSVEVIGRVVWVGRRL
ncbi:MAG: helix-turn-helix transcriptional regulator [Sphingomonadales bacterium]|mgnify:CR=1 FL=1|nr:MAG: helix-turn-helix transcriptional regulator [Sphingomonadales bacterium]